MSCVSEWRLWVACVCVCKCHCRALQDIKKKIQKCKDEKSARLDLAKMDVRANTCFTWHTRGGVVHTYVHV